MSKGNISVQAENIFPIIKKFLYSDHEIFLRELVSNAVDATTKIKTLAQKGEVKGDLGDIKIEIKVNNDTKTLHIIDKGIGMSEDEVNKYLNQMAFSSAEEFLAKYKDDATIIGHFGLGFYSAFMVADKVEVITKSYRDDAPAVKWECDGNPEYTIEPSDKTERGTEIILYINEENKEYLEDHRIKELLNKYCKFLPIEIKFGTKTESTWEGEGDDKAVGWIARRGQIRAVQLRPHVVMPAGIRSDLRPLKARDLVKQRPRRGQISHPGVDGDQLPQACQSRLHRQRAVDKCLLRIQRNEVRQLFLGPAKALRPDL